MKSPKEQPVSLSHWACPAPALPCSIYKCRFLHWDHSCMGSIFTRTQFGVDAFLRHSPNTLNSPPLYRIFMLITITNCLFPSLHFTLSLLRVGFVPVLLPESPEADLGPFTVESLIKHYQINRFKMRSCHRMKTFEHFFQFLERLPNLTDKPT